VNPIDGAADNKIKDAIVSMNRRLLTSFAIAYIILDSANLD
jgi:hypothetical protein